MRHAILERSFQSGPLFWFGLILLKFVRILPAPSSRAVNPSLSAREFPPPHHTFPSSAPPRTPPPPLGRHRPAAVRHIPSARKFAGNSSLSEAFVTMDRLLDKGATGPLYLQRPEIAELVVEALIDSDLRLQLERLS